MAKQIYLDPVSGEPQQDTTPAAPLTAAGTVRTQGVGDQGPDPNDPGSPGPPGLPPGVPTPPPAPNPNPTPAPPAPPPGTYGTPPGGTFVNPDNPNAHAQNPPLTAGQLDPSSVLDVWMANFNPQGHTDKNAWLQYFKNNGGLTAANLEYWKGRFMEAPGTHQEGGGAPPPAPGGGGGGNSLDPSIADFFATQTASLKAQQERDAQIRAIIMQRLALAGQPVDENSAEVTQPLSAARNEAQRSQDAERTALAERLYAQGGLNTGALTQQIQQSSERNAGSLGNLRAGLITHIADAKRAELQSLLQMATAQGDAASARAIQAQISALNASVSSQGQGIQLAEFLALLNQTAAQSGLNG